MGITRGERGFAGSTVGKESVCNAGGLDSIPRLGRFRWRRKWQPTPVFLAWRIPWTEEPGGLQSMGAQRVGHDLATKPHHHHHQARETSKTQARKCVTKNKPKRTQRSREDSPLGKSRRRVGGLGARGKGLADFPKLKISITVIQQ